MVVVARSNQQRDCFINADVDILKRPDHRPFGLIKNASCQPFNGSASANFQSPGDPVAALRMSVFHPTADFQSPGIDRTLPGNHRLPIWGRMCGDAVSLHLSRNANIRIRRIGHHAEITIAAPSLNKGVVGRAFHLHRQQWFKLRTAETQILTPYGERLFGGVLISCRQSGETGFRVGQQSGSLRFQMFQQFGHTGEGNLGAIFCHQTRILPLHQIAVVAISRCPRDERQRNVFACFQRNTEFLLSDKRVDGFLPRFRPVRTPHVSDNIELPKSLLPDFNVSCGQLAVTELLTQRIEQR